MNLPRMSLARYRAHRNRAPRQKPVDREGPIHRTILAYLRVRFPDAVIHHSPNAIGLSGDKIKRQIAHNKAMGTVKGFPDLVVLAGGPPMLFEVKPPRAYPSKAQRALHDHLRALGYRVAVVRSIEDVDAALMGWAA